MGAAWKALDDAGKAPYQVGAAHVDGPKPMTVRGQLLRMLATHLALPRAGSALTTHRSELWLVPGACITCPTCCPPLQAMAAKDKEEVAAKLAAMGPDRINAIKEAGKAKRVAAKEKKAGGAPSSAPSGAATSAGGAGAGKKRGKVGPALRLARYQCQPAGVAAVGRGTRAGR